MRTSLKCVLFLAAALQCATAAETITRKSPELAFTLPGQGQQLLSQYRGKVVALEFILTTCPHCQAASQVMNRIQQKYGAHGFQAIDVAVDPGADAKVENFAKQYHTVFPVGCTPIEQMMTYMTFTDRPAVPQLILIDRDGNIHYETPRIGDAESMKEEVISQRVEELLQRGSHARAARK